MKKKTNLMQIEKDLHWLYEIIKNKIKHVADTTTQKRSLPAITDQDTYYADFIEKNNITDNERVLILLALAAEIKPDIFEIFQYYLKEQGTSLIQCGGITTPTFRGFLPTIQTAYFVLTEKLSDQAEYDHLFKDQHKLFACNILKKITHGEHDPEINRQLKLTASALSYILTGEDITYEYSSEFPATELTTEMRWEELVLSEHTNQQLKELLAWITHGKTLADHEDMKRKLQPGYRALFYGPAGTGKTLTAALIGKKAGKPVYRVDLSRLISKYIGETEKNLEHIFTVAKDRDWILFFDEADALFGRRTDIKNSNDRHANQGTAYLLQRIESCHNIAILASNLKGNLDHAFTRRFQSIIYFPMPGEEERLQLWQKAYPADILLAKEIDMKNVAKKFTISGAAIINIVRYTSLMALQHNSQHISAELLLEAIRREYTKEGRTI